MKSPLLILIISLFCSSVAISQQRFSVASGPWNSTSTWSTTSGGAPGASVPVAGDAVTIERGFTVNITADANCASLQLGGLTANNAGNLTFAAGAITLTVSGNIQLGGSGNANRDGSITFQNQTVVNAGSLNLGGTAATPGQGSIVMTTGGTLNVSGAVSVTGAGNGFTAGTGLVQLSGTSTLIAPFTAFNNLTINGGTTSLGANTTVAGFLTVSSGSFDANTRTNTVTGLTTVSGGSYLGSTALQTFNGGLTISGGTFTGAAGGVTTTNVTLSSGTLIAPSGTFNVSGNWDVSGGTFTPGANTVTFNNGAARTINTGGQAFNNFSHTTNNTLQLITNDLQVNGTFTNSNGTFNTNGFATTVLGLTTISGGNYQASTGLQTFSGGLTVSGGTFTGSTGGVTTTNVTLSSGTLIAPSGTFEVSGNWLRSTATFTPGANTVTFTLGTGTQTLNSGGSAFNNIIHSGTGILQLITNNLTINGTLINSAGDFDANGRSITVTGLTTLSGGTFFSSISAQSFNGGVTISGGTLTGSSGNISTTNLLLTSGILTAPSSAINVSGNWTYNGGVFSPGIGTVNFNGTGAQTINGTVATQTFNNISINKTAGTLLNVSGSTVSLAVGAFTQNTGNFTAPATFTATGAVILNGGVYTSGTNTNLEGDFIVFNAATFTAGPTVTFGGLGIKTIAGGTNPIIFNNLVIASGQVLFGNNNAARTINILNNLTIATGSFSSGATSNGVHTINLNGNLQNDGVIDFSANSATAHLFILLGSTKTIGGAGTSVFQNLRMNTTASANVNLNKSIRVNGTLNWAANGLLVLNGSDFIFGNTAAVTGPSALQYIQSDGTASLTGQVIKVNNNTTATWQFLFPIGTTTNGYSPLDMTAASGTVVNTAPTLNSALSVKAIISPDETGKLKRTFRMTVSGNAAATTFTGARFNYYSPTDVSGLEPISSYTSLWYQKESAAIWTAINGTAPGVTNTAPTLSYFTAPTAIPQPLTNDTYYFTIGTPGAYGQTWYSYQSGNWNDPLSWTTDGSLFPLYINPSPSKVPGVGDNVVITSGKTITMNTNNVSANSINITGTLDISGTTGHSFSTISGTGRIKLAGTTDNFPAGNASNFIDNAFGGTVEINGTGILLDQVRTFNNLVINMAGNSDVVVLKRNVTLNGDLLITRGLLQFEDITAPANRSFTVNGNVSIDSNGGIRTFASNNRHEFNLYGNFANNGTSYFTNRVAADYDNEATDGIVDVNFLSASRDQQASCNGVTRFYRIEVNKGTDDTYKVSLSASDVANFNLFGRANVNIDAASGTNDNALGLIVGTVEIGNNVVIAQLNTTTLNYAIYERAQLWVNGGSVSKIGDTSGNGAIVPYGKVRISSGSLTADVGSGLTLRDDGVVQVDGGTLISRVIRTSVLGVGAVGTYTQSGGNVTLTGTSSGSISGSYAVLSLTYPGNVFNMSGGTLTVNSGHNTTGVGVIFINSDPANVSVTGGTVIMNITNNNPYRVTSKVPFWNVIMRKTGGTNSTIQLLGTQSGTGVFPDLQTLAIQPLVVLNDFTIESPVIFNTNNDNVSIGGNFEIRNGAIYTHGTNTTTINGQGVSSLIFGNTAATQTFNNLVFNKANTSDQVVITTGRSGPTNAAMQVDGQLSIIKGIFDYGSFVASARGTVTLSSGVIIGKTASTGRLSLNGASGQTLNSSLATIHNLEINNTNNVTLGTNNLTILGALTMTAGVFDINIYRLTIGAATNPTASINGSGFNSSKMIRLSGNASDEGLELYLDANETLFYPIGTNASATPRYTPVTAVFQNFADDGFVRISLGDSELATSNLAAGAGTIISYYWRVQHAGFSVLPRVTSYTFNAQDFDDADAGATPAGLVTGFRPGKVLDVNPFTRSSEVTTNISAFAITFNGNSGSGATPFLLESANYTAGTSLRFTGSPTVYYSRSAGATGFPGLDWHNGNSWSLVSHTGAAAGSFPTAGSIAIIGSGNTGANNHHSINVTNNNAVAAELIFAAAPSGTFQARLTVQPNRNITFGRVSGPGTVMIRVTTTQQPVVTGDFGDFSLEPASQYNYTSQENSTTPIVLPTNPVVFPNLRFEGGDAGGGTERRMTIPANIIVRRNINVDRSANFVIGGNVTVLNDVLFNDGTQGRIEFPSTGTNLTFTIERDLLLRGGAGTNNFVVNNSTPSSLQHRLIVGRNITIDNGNLILFNGTGTANNAILEIGGTVNGEYTNTAGTTPSLYQLVMNKGTSIASTFTLSKLSIRIQVMQPLRLQEET
ncbi:MAG: hypothetical protein EBR30_05900 [Cytophagia bacterium]|nr:hypothetical protein [Cytophagia bacterium]